MASIAIILLIISAFTHAGWNLISKRKHPTAGFFLIASVTGSICLSPMLIMHWRVLPAFPALVWVYLVATGLCLAVYYIALAGAYRSGHFSIAYPLIRSYPVIVVIIVSLLLGRGQQVNNQCILGIIIIVAGCYLLPMKKFTEFRLKNYFNLTCLFALVAALGSAGYSIIDDEALRQLRQALTLENWKITLIYAALESVSGSIWLAVFVLAMKKQRVLFKETFKVSLRQAALTGVMIYFTYTLVLLSLAFVKNVSYVVAFRQLSVPLGAIFAIVFLKEPAYLPKLAGLILMFIGLALVGTG